MNKRLRIGVFFVLAYLLVSVFSSFSMMTMNHYGEMQMGGCPFMIGETALCQTSAQEHIALWQEMTTALLPGIITFMLLIAAALLTFNLFRYLREPPDPTVLLYNGLDFRRSLFGVFLLGSAISPRAP